MLWIDQKYINLLSPRLTMFSKKENDIWNMRCPICGDSKKSRTKARGYILKKKDSYLFMCHNCHAAMPLRKFIETIDPQLYQEYIKETILEKASPSKSKQIEPDIGKFIIPKFVKYTALSTLKKVSQLPVDHPVKAYINQRKIPTKYHSKLFYAPKFKTWTNTLIPEKFSLEGKDEPRLIIPFVDKDGNLFGYQGRALTKIEPRYITIILNENIPKVYGMESVDFKQKIYITEGPIDSMFINNSLAMAGSHLDKAIRQLNIQPENVVLVYDNEPRNKEIVKAIDKGVDEGYSVCIWPEHLPFKDINEMVVGGLSQEEVRTMIDNHTFRGLVAKTILSQWKRV